MKAFKITLLCLTVTHLCSCLQNRGLRELEACSAFLVPLVRFRVECLKFTQDHRHSLVIAWSGIQSSLPVMWWVTNKC